MTDPLVALFDPLLLPLAQRLGLEGAGEAVVRLLNAAALDGLCGHPTHGDRLLDAVVGPDAPASLRRRLAAMISARRRLWPEDRRILKDWQIEEARGGVMLRTECIDLDAPAAAALAVRLLIDVPPASMEELHARLVGLKRPSLRSALRRSLERSDIPDALVDLLGAAFEAVGGPGRQSKALARLAADPDRPPQHREAAWRVLLTSHGGDMEAMVEAVGVELSEELAGLGFGAVLRRIGGSAELADELGAQVAELTSDARRDVIEAMERVRLQEGVPGAALYSRLVAERTAPELDDVVVPALIEDGGPAAEAALVAALSAEADPVRGRVLRRGLLVMRTARIEPRGPDETRAWVGQCDGQAAFPVVIVTPNKRGRHRLASVVVRARGEIRDGFVADDLETPRLEDLLQRYRESADLVEIPAGLAAVFVEEAVVDESTLPSLPPDVERAADEILRHENVEYDLPHVAPRGGRLTLAMCRALCDRPALEGWYLDPADLLACDIARPPAGSAAALAWTRAQAKRVDDPRVRGRLAAMTAHLARLLIFVGETEEAKLATRIAQDLEIGSAQTFLRVILERTALTLRPEAAPGVLRFGDEGQREDLRRQLSPEVPRGRDLGTLDLLDLLLCCDQDLFQVHVDAARVRPDVRRAALTHVGEDLAATLASGGRGEPTRLAEILVSGGVDAAAAPLVARQIVTLTDQFREEVCAGCPVGCWSRPDEPVGRAWSGPGHPAFVQLHDGPAAGISGA